MKLTQKELRRFWTKVDRNGSLPPAYTGLTTPCSTWIGGKSGEYGTLYFRNRVWRAHRVAWVIANNSSIPFGMFICHKCDNPSCVNAEHLFCGTSQDNMTDMVSKNRQSAGEKHRAVCPTPPSHSGEEWRKIHPPNKRPRGENGAGGKLKEEDVIKIRSLYASKKYRQKDLAIMFGVNQTMIGFIVRGVSWTHIPMISNAIQ